MLKGAKYKSDSLPAVSRFRTLFRQVHVIRTLCSTETLLEYKNTEENGKIEIRP